MFQDKKKFVPVKIENGKSIHQFDFYKDAMEPACDCYINVPVAKHHCMAKLTLGLKNIMGIIGGNRGEIHKDLAQRIADLNLVVRPRLTIIDATRILLRNGPTGGKLEDVKVLDTLVASADTVAADAYATTLFGMKPEELASTVAGAKLGLGEMDLAKVKIVTAAMHAVGCDGLPACRGLATQTATNGRGFTTCGVCCGFPGDGGGGRLNSPCWCCSCGSSAAPIHRSGRTGRRREHFLPPRSLGGRRRDDCGPAVHFAVLAGAGWSLD